MAADWGFGEFLFGVPRDLLAEWAVTEFVETGCLVYAGPDCYHVLGIQWNTLRPVLSDDSLVVENGPYIIGPSDLTLASLDRHVVYLTGPVN